MLKFFSRMERTRNFVLLLFAILMVVSLIVFYAPTRGNGTADSLLHSDETIAKVAGERIAVSEIALQKDQSRRGGRPTPTDSLLNRYIGLRVIRSEVNRLGLRATDREVADFIRQQQKNPDGTPFDQAAYKRNVTEQMGSVNAYEEAVRDDIGARKLEAFLTSGVTVSEQEVLEDYQKRQTKFDLTYVPVTSTDLAQTIKPSDEELRAYFDKNKQNYYINVPQKKIKYIYLDSRKIAEKINVSDEDLQTAFNEIPADKKSAGVEGQQIVLRIPKAELEDEIQKKADEIYTKATKDGKISAEAFAELVKGYSEDAASRANDGKLPGLVKENQKNPDDPYQQLLKMTAGDVTKPIKYQDRIFILRRGEDVPKKFEDTKKELEVSAKNKRAFNATGELAQKVADRLKETKDLQKTAEEFAAQANMSPKDMIKETGFVKPGDTIEGIGNSPQFEEGIAGLENQGDVGGKISVPNGFVVPILADKREPRDAEFDEVKEQIAETVKVEQARSRVEEIAKQIAAGAGSVNGLAAAAQSKGLKAQDAKTFVLGSPLGQGPGAATNEALENAIFALKAGEVTKTPVKIGDSYYVVGVNSREEASTEEFAKQRDQLFEQKLEEKRGRVFSDYLASRRQELKNKGEIVVYQDVVAKLDEATNEAEN